jgi:short-subunit dehydrogenase
MRGEDVLITGGSSGIGLAAARRFVDQGARVWLTARDERKLKQAVESLGSSARFIPSDVTDPASVQRLAHTLSTEAGGLDTLINSAGLLHLTPAETGADLAEQVMSVNYLGLTRVVAAALPLLRLRKRRSIVSLSSFAGRLAPPYFGIYSASKWAVEAYSHSLRQELHNEGFHVGLVLPGPVRSPMTADLFGTPMYPVPFGVPVITPEVVAEAILRTTLNRRAETVVPGRFSALLRLGAAFPRLVDLFYRPYLNKSRRR